MLGICRSVGVRLGPAAAVLLICAFPAMAEIHWQRARTRCRLPTYDYQARATILSLTVPAPLTAAIPVEVVLSESESALLARETTELPAPLSAADFVSPADVQRQREIVARLLRDSPASTELAPASAALATMLETAERARQRESHALDLELARRVAGSAPRSSGLEQTRVNRAQRSAVAKRLAAAERAGLIPSAAAQSIAEGVVRAEVLSKTFRIGRQARLSNGVILDRAVLTIEETGAARVSARLKHDGGPNRALLGSDVTVRFRVYGDSGRFELADPDGALFWETTEKRSVRRGETEEIAIQIAVSEELRRHFGVIERAEVNLESRLSR